MRIYQNLSLAEQLNSGVRNIFEYYKFYSEQKPRLEENDVFNCFVYTDKNLDNVNVTENVTEKVVENLTDNQIKNIQLIEKSKFITAKEIAANIKISHRKVQENMLKLKSMGNIQRIAADSILRFCTCL